MLSREKKKEEEAGFALDLGFLPHAASMFSCVGCFWVLLSSALVAVCSFSFISPAWIVKEQPRSGHQHPHPHDKGSVSFGLLWHCSESLDRMYRCYTFGGLGRFAEIPSSSWQEESASHRAASAEQHARHASKLQKCHQAGRRFSFQGSPPADISASSLWRTKKHKWTA
uniref:Si:dkey-35m8.1 n=1 Tax=Oryzias sinensis TaxID=183150 RepID=A0A8C7XWE0_9TELE